MNCRQRISKCCENAPQTVSQLVQVTAESRVLMVDSLHIFFSTPI